MPYTSTGTVAATRSARSVPATRARRTGSLMLTDSRGSVPCQSGPGSRTPCSTTWTGARPVSHIAAFQAVTWTTGTRVWSASGWRQASTSPRGVLCSTWTAGTSTPARRPDHSSSSRASRSCWSTTTSGRCSGAPARSCSGVTSTTEAGQSQVCGAAAALGPAPRDHGDEVVVRAPGRTPSSTSRAGATAGPSCAHPREGAVDGQLVHRGDDRRRVEPVEADVLGQRAGARAGGGAGGRAGRRAAGAARPTGPRRPGRRRARTGETTGVPTAAARCAGPVLGATTQPAPARTAASSG